MKKLIITSVLAVLTALTTTVGAQNYPKEYLGLPGDNLNLYAVMDLFRNAPTLEAFERSLNEQDSRINNLDLNGDYRVDYIAVSDYRDGRVHNIVLRAVLGRNEYQDVAVIIVERMKKKRVMIQIIGDELLYGRNYIVEPIYAKNKKIRYYDGPVYYGGGTVINNYYYDIWDWPVVVYIYSPYYSEWSSSWYWGYYPTWYELWSPWYWDYYYGYHSGWNNHYHSYYNHSDHYWYHRYNDYYYHKVRQESPTVQRRVAEGNYRQTYTRPEQRQEGIDLQRRTRASVSEGTRSQAPAATGTRRQATPQAARGTATDTGRRQATGQAASGTAADAGRRQTPPQSVSGTASDQPRRNAAGTAGRSATENDAARRNSEGTVSRGAAETEAGRRAPVTVSRTEEGGASAARESVPVRRISTAPSAAEVTAKSDDSRAAEAREAQNRAAEAREAERRSDEIRAAQDRANEQRAAEAREAQNRAAEQRAAQDRANEQRAAEAREAQNRAAEQRAAEARESERRAGEARAAQERANQERASQERAAQERATQERAAQTRTSESGSEKPGRR